MNAAQAKDYVETISGLDKGLPNVDTLFWRLSECASRDLILREYKKVVKRHFEAAKGADKKKAIIIAIDETHEPFYGRIKNLWIYPSFHQYLLHSLDFNIHYLHRSSK